MKPHTTQSDDPSIISQKPINDNEHAVVKAALAEWGEDMAKAIDGQQMICGGEPIAILEGTTLACGKQRRFKLTFAMADLPNPSDQ